MKKICLFFFALLMIILPLSLCSCDTVFFEDDAFTVGAYFNYGAKTSSDGRYMIMDFDEIFDPTENKKITLQYEVQYPWMLNFQDICFCEENGTVTVKSHAYLQKNYYEAEDGTFDYCEYLPMTYVFRLDGKQLSAENNGEALSKEDFDSIYKQKPSFKKSNSETEGIEQFENYSISNSVYEYRSKDPDTVEPLSELETKLMGKIFEIEKIDNDPDNTNQKFYQFHINARRIDGKVYFSYMYCNKKNWAGQSAVKSGFRSSALLCYDESNGEFTEIIRLGKLSCIMAYSDTCVFYYENNKLTYMNYVTGERTVLLDKLPQRVQSKAFADRVMITASDFEDPFAQIGTTNEHIYVFDLSGNLLVEK